MTNALRTLALRATVIRTNAKCTHGFQLENMTENHVALYENKAQLGQFVHKYIYRTRAVVSTFLLVFARMVRVTPQRGSLAVICAQMR